MKYRPKHVAEYLFMRGIVGLLRILPCRLAMSVGCSVAWIGHRIVRYRVDSAKARIREVFPGRFSEAEIRRIAWISWRNFILSIVDMARITVVTREWMKKHMAGYEEGNEMLEKCLGDGKGAIFTCPHVGSWELGGAAIHAAGAQVFVFATRQKNPLVDDYMTRMRDSAGITCVRRGSSELRGAIRKLKAGEVMGILPDVRIPTTGIMTRFLGKEANIGGGMAALARQADVPIIPAAILRTGLASFSVKIFPVIRPDPALNKDDDARRMTQEVFDIFTGIVSANPEQWFWFNKRWVFDVLHPASQGLRPGGSIIADGELTKDGQSGKSTGS